MNLKILNLKMTLFVAFSGLLAGTAQPAGADDLTIAQTPLFVAANIEPNVMFTLDDSGSMQWEFMPDGGEFRFTLHMFPRPEGLYGGEDYANQVPSFRDDNLHNYFGRSVANNGVFYNPDVTYRPWSRPDGTEMPQADPTAALYNPDRPGLGSLDLTREQTQSAIWFRGNNFNQGLCEGACGSPFTYWPITYYNYQGGNRTARGSYQRVRITSATAAGVTFTSPGGVTRARDAEIQNFANWFQYHRSRILTSRGAIGRAFTQMPDEARVGFAAINQGRREIDGVESDGAVISGVQDFDLAGRNVFYDRLYGRVLNRRGTPLRRAAQRVGEYFERADSQGPWSTTPGAEGGQDLACRQSFHILMTDGFWNGNDPTVGNSDGTAGTTILGPDIGDGLQSFTYNPLPPFADAATNTLADVAMHYWNRDLRPGLENRVPPTDENPAFWQHLASFGFGLGVEGNVNPDTALDAIETQTAIDWGNPFASNPAKIDDLLHFGLNGRGGFFTARDPESFASELGNLLLDIVSRTSATAGVSVSSTRLTEASTVFGSEFDTADWSGNIEAVGENSWSSPTFPGPAGRELLTSNAGGIGGTEFSAQTAGAWPADRIVPVVPGSTTEDVINFIRGDQSNEGEGGAFEFRERNSLLGDIVNSRPVFVGQRNEGWVLLPASQGGGETYTTHVQAKAGYAEALYVGANGGMMHAFNATTGRELFAYVPRAVLPKLADLTDPDYTHQFYVDGQISVQDAYDGAWQRVLVGTLGAGGRGVYAINVTNPANPEVLWEFTSEEDEDLGFTYGAPVITRIGNGGDWVAIFGNGFNSEDNEAVLFVVDLFSGNLRQKIVLEDASGDNGLASVSSSLDPITQRRTARVYGGDLNGTVWRVDFNEAGNGSVRYPGGLFTTPGNRPITSAPALAVNPNGGMMVYVGTGKLIEPLDRLESGIEMERMYAIRDRERTVSFGQLGRPELDLDLEGRRTISGDPGELGWALDLSLSTTATGERVVSRPRVIFGQVIFTTFEPEEDPCAPGGRQRVYVINALTGAGTLDNICPNCAVIELGIGAPVDPAVVIVPPPSPDFGGDDNSPPGDPDSDPPGDDDAGSSDLWCPILAAVSDPSTGPIGLRPICEGRQVWRQVR